jgi:hypothetical protein
VTGTRVALLALLGLVVLPNLVMADDGPRSRRPRLIDPARVRQLAEILHSDPDERRRKAAVGELAEADPRVYPEVMPSLVAALRQDAAGVRAAAAEAIGRFRTIFPLAGQALESAAESDPSPAVREAAKQSLWEYHLNGYRSAKGNGLLLAQTAEPPIARPARPRQAITTEPSTAPATPAAGATLPMPSAFGLPPAAPPPGPRVSLLPGMTGPRSILRGQPVANRTGEPPLAKKTNPPVPTPKLTDEPPILPRWPEPVVIGHSPTFTLELPPIVPPPDGK